jgi:mRNA interferase MazF
VKRYIPDTGDVIWLTFDPQIGREQGGRRPALVLSPKPYNELVGLALVCPATSRAKGYSFEVAMPAIPPRLVNSGVILADHLKSVDWKGRHAAFVGTVPDTVVDDVLAKLKPLLGF